jgi:hypothetical protein
MKQIIIECCKKCPSSRFLTVAASSNSNTVGDIYQRCEKINKHINDENIIHPDCPLPDHLPDAGKMMPTPKEAEQRAYDLFDRENTDQINAYMDCYDWIAERMKP